MNRALLAINFNCLRMHLPAQPSLLPPLPNYCQTHFLLTVCRVVGIMERHQIRSSYRHVSLCSGETISSFCFVPVFDQNTSLTGDSKITAGCRRRERRKQFEIIFPREFAAPKIRTREFQSTFHSDRLIGNLHQGFIQGIPDRVQTELNEIGGFTSVVTFRQH